MAKVQKEPVDVHATMHCSYALRIAKSRTGDPDNEGGGMEAEERIFMRRRRVSRSKVCVNNQSAVSHCEIPPTLQDAGDNGVRGVRVPQCVVCIQLIDLADPGSELKCSFLRTPGVTALACFPRGNKVVFAGNDVVQIWDVDAKIDELLESAKRLAGRNLTSKENKQFFGSSK